jgi:hypothetical protein
MRIERQALPVVIHVSLSVSVRRSGSDPLSFLFVVYDGTKSIADQTTYISRVGPTWINIHPNSLSAFEPAVETLAGAYLNRRRNEAES